MKLSVVLSIPPAGSESGSAREDWRYLLPRLAGLGFPGVELAMRAPALTDIAGLEKLLTRYDLAVPAIGTGQAFLQDGLSFCHPDSEVRAAAIDRVKTHIELASRLNSSVVIGLIRGVFSQEIDKELSQSYVAEAIKICSQYSLGKGCRLLIEPLNRYECSFLHTIGEVKNFLAELGAGNIGILIDTFHMNIEEKDMAGSIVEAAGNIGHVHLADSNRCFPGQGHIDFLPILQALKSVSYQGYLSGEFLPVPSLLEASSGMMSYIRELMEKDNGIGVIHQAGKKTGLSPGNDS